MKTGAMNLLTAKAVISKIDFSKQKLCQGKADLFNNPKRSPHMMTGRD